MVLAILQQTKYSQRIQLADVASLSLLSGQAKAVANGRVLDQVSAFLADAAAANTNLTGVLNTKLLKMTPANTLLPVSLNPENEPNLRLSIRLSLPLGAAVVCCSSCYPGKGGTLNGAGVILLVLGNFCQQVCLVGARTSNTM